MLYSQEFGRGSDTYDFQQCTSKSNSSNFDSHDSNFVSGVHTC